jgi:hypothetical protein
MTDAIKYGRIPLLLREALAVERSPDLGKNAFGKRRRLPVLPPMARRGG